MIGVDELKEGAWYDGFTWYDGRQRGVATMKWRGGRFRVEGLPDLYHVADPKAGRGYTFEPNVTSKGEPES